MPMPGGLMLFDRSLENCFAPAGEYKFEMGAKSDAGKVSGSIRGCETSSLLVTIPNYKISI